jgi:hypothetical protein
MSCPEGFLHMCQLHASTSRRRRLGRTALVTCSALVLAACGASGNGSDGSAPDSTPAATTVGQDVAPVTAPVTPVTVSQVASSPVEVTVSGLEALWAGLPSGAPEPLVPLAEIRSGGPGPDGIPPVDRPTFLPPGAVEFLGETEPVLAIEIDGDARAYPVQILMWHEIVNDTVGGVPVAVTYCPLCNSAVAYDRRIGDRVVDFGTSGSLWNSALVMYDRQTETLWSHFSGAAIVGELTGTELETFPVATVPWGVWRDANPDGLVLSRDTRFDRDYGRNPYPGYDSIDNQPFLFEGEVDGTFTAMTRIVGVELGGEAVGIPLFRLRDVGVVHTVLAGTDIVVFWTSGVSSPLDAPSITDGDDIGATGVFLAELDGMSLTFSASDSGFVDDQTGSTWTLLGRAVAGPLEGRRLERLTHVDTFWFAWAAFQPDTALVE